MYPSKLFDDSSYAAVGHVLESIFGAYKDNRSIKRNWRSIFNQVESLQGQHNPELDESFCDVSFCLYFYHSLLLLQKHHDCIFNNSINKLDWDFIVKFWGPVLEGEYCAYEEIHEKANATGASLGHYPSREFPRARSVHLLERLFVSTGLSLKWGDIILTVKDVATDGNFKVDMRVLKDSVLHQYNKERDLTVAEAGKNDPDSFKY
ncbi:uncharacterized protein RHIMIDRAFT_289744 [Rhizopus microsporus ATCC 52813]|uniref:Uncharacterized protein n=1 Tax=Rhizopus microsporus ATCC 52813 TaxID=1340429 RepID=A0A2G4T2R3_RHIZD|nr:uncharacterized protein RHIMIDRAFT_289744 [Rhizopus microsporus ATCC 52813]PHZ15305.1 hypothetical protein RHIMIDRAFT_289744 [Rhizopus microsporus ATCC 52813]